MAHPVFIIQEALQLLHMIHASVLIICLVINPLGSIRLARAQTNPQDVEALKLLHGSWSGNPSWDLKKDPCTGGWLGIICDEDSTSSAKNQGNRVTSMLLPNQDLSGTLHPAIGNLSSLLYMDLSSNPQLGGQIPSEIGKLKQIKRFYVISCNLNGSIPADVGDMTPLEYLGLANNSLTGPIPNSVGNLRNLIWFDVSYNLLSGKLPVSSHNAIDGTSTVGLDNLTSAEHIHIQNNRFSGIVPSSLFSSTMKLQHLLLAENEFEGPIPLTIHELPYLDIIRLDSNKFNGSIPSNFANITHLATLQLDNNMLTGQVPDLSNCINLRILTLDNNGFDASEIPNWIMKLGNLSSLSMDSSNLSGAIPRDLFGFSKTLTDVSLAFNQLNGTLDLTSPNLSPVLGNVNLTRNDLTDLLKGSYNKTLMLIGNPVCIGKNSVECQPEPSSPVQSPSVVGDVLTSTYCSSIDRQCKPYYRTNPKEPDTSCKCALPVVVIWTFYAMKIPKFTDMEADDITSLFVKIEDEFLYMWNKSIFVNRTIPLQKTQLVMEVESANQLAVSIFPPTGIDTWSNYNVTYIQFVLQNQDIWFTSIGPMSSYFPNPRYTPPSQGSNMLTTSEKLGIGFGVSLMGIIILILAICIWKLRKRAENAEKQAKPFASWISSKNEQPNIPQLKGARWFSFEEIKQCTNNLNSANQIGSGGYGKVYKGVLQNSGEVVAIKRSDAKSLQGVEEFKNEVELLSRVHHRNLVGLIGFCFEEGEQMLVYKYMPNGTLREALTGKSGVHMDWNRRIELALGAAKGIAYLHNEAHPPIIHTDIKSNNILLDEHLTAVVADFGLSKPTVEGDVMISIDHTNIKGTMGYLDPNYLMNNELTVKSDVYSFGVMLLELVTGRLPIEEGKYMVYDVKNKVAKVGVDDVLPLILDPNLIRQSYPKKGVARFIDLALKCLQDDPIDRPTMVEVCRELEEISLINHYGDWNKAKEDLEVEDKSPSCYTNLVEDMNHLLMDEPKCPMDVSSLFYFSGGSTSIITRAPAPK